MKDTYISTSQLQNQNQLWSFAGQPSEVAETVAPADHISLGAEAFEEEDQDNDLVANLTSAFAF
ncbi:MAG: hypothetical protein KC910_12520 [Candidatus Eremiobacteraeota bacterium]|nr:hypothetical protein [Candidatus Eremiobacteraeota bacterium]